MACAPPLLSRAVSSPFVSTALYVDASWRCVGRSAVVGMCTHPADTSRECGQAVAACEGPLAAELAGIYRALGAITSDGRGLRCYTLYNDCEMAVHAVNGHLASSKGAGLTVDNAAQLERIWTKLAELHAGGVHVVVAWASRGCEGMVRAHDVAQSVPRRNRVKRGRGRFGALPYFNARQFRGMPFHIVS